MENKDDNKSVLNEVVRNANQANEVIIVIKKYKLLLKGENRKMIGMMGKQGELLKKIKETEEFFNHVDFSRSNIYFKIRMYKFLTSF